MTAPSVTENDVLAAIKKIDYVVLANGRTTICQLTLDNGFTVEGQSACVSAENFNQSLGESYAYEDAKRKVWQLLGFRLADQIAAGVDVVTSAGNDFGWALAKLREGKSVNRAGWNGANQSLSLQSPDINSKMTLPYIYITTVQGQNVPWLASQSDMLATDWQVVG